MNEIKEAIILAAGEGKRMGFLTKDYPKGLLTYKEEPILKRLIRQLKNLEIEKIIIVTGFGHEKVKNELKNIEGIKCYSSLALASKENDIGLVILVIPPEKTLAIIDEINIIKLKDVWFQPGSESEEARLLCEQHNLNCTMNACIMKKT